MAIRKRKKPAAKKKIIKKKIARKKAAPRKKAALKKVVRKVRAAKKEQNIIGLVTHYFPKVRAAAVKLKAPLAIGDVIKIKGHTTDFKQTVTSLQIDRVGINTAKKGQEIGLLVDSRVRQHDVVYKV